MTRVDLPYEFRESKTPFHCLCTEVEINYNELELILLKNERRVDCMDK